MSTEEEERKAICILSFDNGGPGTYSQLLILKEYMSRLAKDLGVAEQDVYPADYFELMGGVGFGGLVALMLGRLRMNVDDAIDALIAVANAIFPEGSQDIPDPEANSGKLKEGIEDMLQTRGLAVTTKMHERSSPETRCKVVLYAATSANIRHPQAFRTYSSRGASLNPTIVEAVCATMATPSYFVPVNIGRSPQSFVGGAVGTNNPTRELLKEASTVFGNEKRVAQILSTGCGIPPVQSLEAMTSESGPSRVVKEIPTDCQVVATELATRLYEVDAYLRLSVDKGIGNIEMDQWGMLGDIEMHTACYIESQTVSHALEGALKRLKQRPSNVTIGHLNTSSTIKTAAKKAPAVSPYFVRRDKEWEELVYHLVTSVSSRQRILPITGMGGCGKTQLVSYFLQEYPTLHAVYVDASTLSSIETDLQTWARELGDGHERDTWEDAVRILTKVPEDERWGLILDNADDPDLNLNPVIPQSKNLTVIITSRNRNLGNLSTTHHMELGEMEPDEALATLLRAARCHLPLTDEESKSAHAILKELGCLAVALVQAGTYCHELSCLFTQYLTLFNSHRAELMKRAEPFSLDNYQRGAYTALDLSYKALPQPSRDFLHFISFFHHTNIPLSALATAARADFEDGFHLLPRPEAHKRVHTDLRRLLCTEGNWNEMQVQDTIRTLRSFSLLSITLIDDSIFLHLHPLIQSWAKDMDPASSQHHRAMFLQVLTTCCRDDAFLLRQYLLPHILDMLDQMRGRDMHINDLMATGTILQLQGHYRAAAESFATALEITGETTDDNEQTIEIISGRLARVYRAQGRLNEAEKLQVTLLEQRRRVLGVDHLSTMRAVTNLARTYQAQGRWSEAEKLQVEVLEKLRRLLGMEDPYTVTVAANLATTYSSQHRYSEAEKLEVQALEQCRKERGMEHPKTITIAANLAATYRSQHRYSEAEKLQVEVLEQCRKVLGMEHPKTVTIAANLAATYEAQDRHREAEKLQVEVLEQCRRAQGMEHRSTITIAADLAATYRSQDRHNEAEELEVEVLQQRTKVLGMEHPDTIKAAANLATAYGNQGRWAEGVALLAPAVQLSLKVLGQTHPHTQKYLRNLASIYDHLGKRQEARETRRLLISPESAPGGSLSKVVRSFFHLRKKTKSA